MASMYPIQNVTVGSTASTTIDFTSIPNNYTDLMLLCSLRTNSGGASSSVTLRFNSDTGTNYKDKSLYGSGVVVFVGSDIYGTDEIYSGEASGDTSLFSVTKVYIPNYAGNKYKVVQIESGQEDNQTTAYTFLGCGVWKNTAAITSISFRITSAGAGFPQYSTATLYGIK